MQALGAGRFLSFWGTRSSPHPRGHSHTVCPITFFNLRCSFLITWLKKFLTQKHTQSHRHADPRRLQQPTSLASKLLVLSSKKRVLVHSGTDKTYFWLAWCLDFLASSHLGVEAIAPSPPWIRPRFGGRNTGAGGSPRPRRATAQRAAYSFRMSNRNFTFTGSQKHHPSCPLSNVWKIPQNTLKYCGIT